MVIFFLVPRKEEIKRIKPVLELIRKSYPGLLISIDTYHAEVAELCLSIGADWINDISGGRHDHELLNILAK